MRLISRFAVALLLVTLAGTAIMGKTKRERIVFQNAVKIDGTIVKAGTYDVVFDENTNELSIIKGRKVIAKAAARTEQREFKSRGTQFQVRKDGDAAQLVSVTFGSSDKEVVVGQAGMQAGGNN